MKGLKVLMLVVFAILFSIINYTYAQNPNTIKTVLTNCVVIDCTGKPPMEDMTVVITGGRIAEIKRETYDPSPGETNVRVFNLTGSDSNPVGEIGLLEIEQLVFSGMTEMQALIAATRNCADLCGVLNKLGTVEEGKLADLIVVSGNPLNNISNLRKLEMVFKDGKPVNLEKDEGQASFWELYFVNKQKDD